MVINIFNIFKDAKIPVTSYIAESNLTEPRHRKDSKLCNLFFLPHIRRRECWTRVVLSRQQQQQQPPLGLLFSLEEQDEEVAQFRTRDSLWRGGLISLCDWRVFLVQGRGLERDTYAILFREVRTRRVCGFLLKAGRGREVCFFL